MSGVTLDRWSKVVDMFIYVLCAPSRCFTCDSGQWRIHEIEKKCVKIEIGGNEL